MNNEEQVLQNHFGDVSITWREPMSIEEVGDLRDFTDIWLRGIERRAKAASRKAAFLPPEGVLK